jgi:hypothetical protein
MGEIIMSYKRFFYLGLVLLLLCAGCGLTEGVVQKEPKSFLWFTGNTQNAIAYIDDLAPIELENKTNRTKKLYHEIAPGKHTIIVKRSGEEIVNRNVLLGNGITKEIQIP